MPDNTNTPPVPPIFAEGREITENINSRGGAESGLSTAFSDDGYALLRYPQDLGTNPALKNYVAFYINLRQRDAAGAYEKRLGTVVTPKNAASAENRITSQNTKGFDSVIKVASGVAVGKMIGGDSTIGQVGAGAAIAALGSTEAGQKVTNIVLEEAKKLVNSGGNNLQTVQLKKVIALHMNGRPSTSHSAAYDSVDMGVMGGLIRENSLEKIGTALGNINFTDFDTFAAGAMDVLQQTTGPLGSLAFKNLQSASILGSGPVGENISRSMNITTNPFKEQVFRNMGNRTFAFDYVFLPKSKDEALRVKNIIDTFKYYMHPSMNIASSYWLSYPAEFNIKFFYQGKENEYLHKISTCVLTDMQVDYGSGEDFMTFEPDYDDNAVQQNYGIPTEITLKLQFKELEILTRERIAQGY